jgi:small-conductance mechanosensitive channel
MNETVLPSRFWLLAAAVLVACLWLLYALTSADPVLGEGSARAAIDGVATIASAALIVALLGTAVLTFTPGGSASPTGFQRVVVYGLLTAAAAYFTLHHFGYQLEAIFTTSAIATAAIALALQPTLGSMIAGMAIQTDRILHVGDGVIMDGEPVRIVSMSWRVVVGRRPDGRIMVIPNAKLSDNMIEILPRDAALCRQTLFSAPASGSPQHICDLVREMVADFSSIDSEQPITVAPLEVGSKDPARFRISYWVRPWWEAAMVEGEIVRRIWYLFQRHGLTAAPAGSNAENPVASLQAYGAEVAQLVSASPAQAAELVKRIGESGRLLLFAPDERLVMPKWSEAHQFLLLRGDVVYRPNFDLMSQSEAIRAPLWVQQPGRVAAIRRLAAALTAAIGPYADLAVQRAAERTSDFEDLCRDVAIEIDGAAKRQSFLDAFLPEQSVRVTPGTVLETRRDASGDVVCRFGLKAASEVEVLVLPRGTIPERLLPLKEPLQQRN